jgi:hypothetical protein
VPSGANLPRDLENAVSVRLTTAWAAFLCFAASASATTVSPRPRDAWLAGKPVPSSLVKTFADSDADEGFTMTDQTEIRLDGKTCKYADVPKDAQITLLEVSKDRVILKIHFRSKK